MVDILSRKYRIPITAITVFGSSSLLAIAVVIVLYLGFNQAATSTYQLWAEQSKTLIDAMEQSLDSQLRPVREQARWVAQEINDVSDLGSLDDFINGSFAAIPQVAGVAIVTADGNARRWLRGSGAAVSEDWSQRRGIAAWISTVKAENAMAWRAPIWEKTVAMATLLHDIPLHDEEGEFIGVFAQIVPIRELSGFLSRTYADTGITPFVLYDKQYVLAHPMMISDGFHVATEQQPLPTFDDVGDIILTRLWTPGEYAPYIADLLPGIDTNGAYWGDDYYLYLYRNIQRYGPAPWTIGAYINTTMLSDAESQRLFSALGAGIAVLLIGILASIVVGRAVSQPITAMVRAANAINAEQLDQVPTLLGSAVRELDEASKAFNNMLKGLRERKLIRDTLGRFVPREVAQSLLSDGGELQPRQTAATILFCDIEAFTQLTETLGPVKIVEVLNAYFSVMVAILEHYGGVVTQFQGDAILATFNVPVVNSDHANNAVLAAREMLARVASDTFALEKLNIRVGINTGQVIAGAIGARGRLSYTVHGNAVNLAARLESMNKDYATRLLISADTAALAQDFAFTSVGQARIRGQSQSIALYTLEGGD